MVNVWGSEDVLYKLGIAGKRENFCGLNTINIEIEGATHFDYMRRDPADTANPPNDWNIAVADFVTDLMIDSDSEADLLNFFSKHRDIISSPDARGVYVVKLPGWESHQ